MLVVKFARFTKTNYFTQSKVKKATLDLSVLSLDNRRTRSTMDPSLINTNTSSESVSTFSVAMDLSASIGGQITP